MHDKSFVLIQFHNIHACIMRNKAVSLKKPQLLFTFFLIYIKISYRYIDYRFLLCFKIILWLIQEKSPNVVIFIHYQYTSTCSPNDILIGFICLLWIYMYIVFQARIIFFPPQSCVEEKKFEKKYAIHN